MITRSTLFLLLVSMNFSVIWGQVSILFVDDSDDNFGNAELFYVALDSIGYVATYYNAVDSAAGPTDLYMNNFDLVVWHTSSDGSELLFWNGLDEDNASVKSYLNGGGKLWLVGNDFFFDRYGSSSVDFSAGDFAYDYLGIASLDVQSYVDDGETGVPTMIPDVNAVIAGLNNLTWQFPTLWYADGVSLTDEATPIYRMGDSSYILADSISATYLDNGTYQVLTYFFDIALVNNFDMLKDNLLPVMSFFDAGISNNANELEIDLKANVFPNPTSSVIDIELELANASEISISLVNMYGQLVSELMPVRNNEPGKKVFQFTLNPSIPNGYYFVKVNVDTQIVLKSFILQK